MDYTRARDSSLELGISMGWALEPGWSGAWVDREITYCDSFYRNPQTLHHFLKFTQVRINVPVRANIFYIPVLVVCT